MYFLNCAYPIRCLRVPPEVRVSEVEDHWSRKCETPDASQFCGPPRPIIRDSFAVLLSPMAAVSSPVLKEFASWRWLERVGLMYQFLFKNNRTAKWPHLWSSGQSSRLQIWRPGFDSRHYQKKRVVGLERGPLSLVSTTEELLDRKVAAPV
jgi:hypothetical protein